MINNLKSIEPNVEVALALFDKMTETEKLTYLDRLRALANKQSPLLDLQEKAG